MQNKVKRDMEEPRKIYLQVCMECPKEDCKNCQFENLADNVTWCRDRIFKNDKIYISKSYILEWAKKKKAKYDANNDDAVRWGQANAFQQLIDMVNKI